MQHQHPVFIHQGLRLNPFTETDIATIGQSNSAINWADNAASFSQKLAHVDPNFYNKFMACELQREGEGYLHLIHRTAAAANPHAFLESPDASELLAAVRERQQESFVDDDLLALEEVALQLVTEATARQGDVYRESALEAWSAMVNPALDFMQQLSEELNRRTPLGDDSASSTDRSATDAAATTTTTALTPLGVRLTPSQVKHVEGLAHRTTAKLTDRALYQFFTNTKGAPLVAARMNKLEAEFLSTVVSRMAELVVASGDGTGGPELAAYLRDTVAPQLQQARLTDEESMDCFEDVIAHALNEAVDRDVVVIHADTKRAWRKLLSLVHRYLSKAATAPGGVADAHVSTSALQLQQQSPRHRSAATSSTTPSRVGSASQQLRHVPMSPQRKMLEKQRQNEKWLAELFHRHRDHETNTVPRSTLQALYLESMIGVDVDLKQLEVLTRGKNAFTFNEFSVAMLHLMKQ